MRLSSKAKLAGAFVLIPGCLGAAAYFGIASLGAGNDRPADLVDNTAQQSIQALQLRYYAAQVSRNTWKLLAETDTADMQTADRAAGENLAAIDNLAQSYRALADAEGVNGSASCPSRSPAVRSTPASGAASTAGSCASRCEPPPYEGQKPGQA